MPTRRLLLAGTLAIAATSSASSGPVSRAAAWPADLRLFAILDAVGRIEADEFHPARALDAMQALMALAPEPRVEALRRYCAARTEVPSGMFAVVRALIEVPGRDQPETPFPGVLQPGFLRPPALGGPVPREPDDLEQVPHWPVILLDDVPLVEVAGYRLGGVPEPLSMHLEGLAGATWRTKPLAPGSAGSLRYLLIHWGRWTADADASARFEAQIRRYEHG